MASRVDEDESKREDATGHCRRWCSDRISSSEHAECPTDATSATMEVVRARLRNKEGFALLALSPVRSAQPKGAQRTTG